MQKINRIISVSIWIVVTAMVLAGCNFINLLYPEPTLAAMPTATQAPLKELSICLGYEPRSLYMFQAAAVGEREVLQALTDGPIDTYSDGTKSPVLLNQLPSFENGSAVFSPAALRTGDAVVNSAGDLVAFEAGTRIFPSGCGSTSCAVEWDGVAEIQVDQLTVKYELKPGLRWSDGEALTSADFVYAFELAADPLTPVNKHAVDLTQSYTALDEVTIEWIGIPGLVTDAFEEFLWAPLPKHALENRNAEELLDDENANMNPLSYGPFVIDEWKRGEYIRMVKNNNYHRADEGLPVTDVLTFRFLSADDPASLLTAASAACDLVSPSALDMQDIAFLSDHAAENGMALKNEMPDSLEVLAFGITPASYDDYYYPYGADRPDLFGDVRTRQAITQCIDKQTLGNKLLGASVELAATLLPSSHPLSASLASDDSVYSPANALELLTQIGWMDADFNPETPLTAVNVYNVPPGTPFSIELLTTDSPLRAEIAGEIASNLEMCGIDVSVTQLPISDFYQPAPDGKIFGRQFDMALFSVQLGEKFACSYFKSDEMPTEANYWLGETTGGANFVGFIDDDYDRACAASEQIGLDRAAADQAYLNAIRILDEELPVIPIYFHPEGVLVRDELCSDASSGLSMHDMMIDIEKLSSSLDCS